MKLDGRKIAGEIFAELKQRVGELKQKDIVPHLSVILVGEDPASEAYVLQKQLRADDINAEIEVLTYSVETNTETLLNKIRELNTNSQVHGIIIQRPLPEHINQDALCNAVADEKDIDGFKTGSPYHVPIVMAVVRVLEEIYKEKEANGSKGPNGPKDENEENAFGPSVPSDPFGPFLLWLKSKKTVLLGKGSTAGQPLIDYFKEMGIPFQLIDSKTENPVEITRLADIIISSVGKGEIIKPEILKNGAALIGIGIFRGEDGKLYGDYNEEHIKDIVSSYTPTPGGVGPINVAMLFSNLLTAAEQTI